MILFETSRIWKDHVRSVQIERMKETIHKTLNDVLALLSYGSWKTVDSWFESSKTCYLLVAFLLREPVAGRGKAKICRT